MNTLKNEFHKSAYLLRKNRGYLPYASSLLVLIFIGITTLKCQTFYVSSRNNHSIKKYNKNGDYLGDIVSSGSGGISFPQEVNYHKSGSLLVTGRGNSSIKRYKITSGTYLGDFTTGYVLDNPTKTSIWKDSLIYVSQWGQTQNKVVRFSYTTGMFIDEFTSIGIPNGCGHAWDSLGNLYVAQYGSGVNGKVLKFDTTGQYLGVFIPSGVLAGPVNLWFDDLQNLFVQDWTHGKVFQFNGSTGSYVSTFVTGLVTTEGYTFDSNRALYLCDWTSNIIYKTDTAGALSPFINTGNLSAPNSILIHTNEVTNLKEESENKNSVMIYPNPFNFNITVELLLKEEEVYSIYVMNIKGQVIRTICENERLQTGEYICFWDGNDERGQEVESGSYIVQVNSKNTQQSIQVIKRK